jgi:hypothetical protein
MLSSQGDGTGTTDQALAPKTITGATTADPVVITLASHGYSDGDYLFIEGATGTTEINGLRVVTNKDTNTFEVTEPDGTTIGSAGTFGGTCTCAPAFVYAPTSTEVAVITRLNGYAYDSAFDDSKYFDITALTNGIEVRWYRNDAILKTLTATPVKIWNQWYLNAGVDAQAVDAGVANQTHSPLRWSFFKGCGELRIDGGQTEFIAVIIRDDVSGLGAQEMAIQGHF